MSTPTDAGEPPRQRWLEPFVAVLMALCTVGTAWCSYESAMWTRRANRLVNESNALERRASVLTLQGMEVAIIHTAMFMQILAAQHAGDQKLVSFYAGRFPPDVRKAIEAWLAQKPFENPDADPHPFVPALYQIRGGREAAEASAAAAEKLETSRAAGQTSGQYLASTVLFATVLFFAGTSGKFEQRRVRLAAFGFASALFIYAAIRLGLLPR